MGRDFSWARIAMAAIALTGLCLPAAARAGERADHDLARAAVQAGEVMPLSTLLERLQHSHPGQVLRVELEREDGRWAYELRLLQPGGRLLKLEVDARTGEVLEVKERKPPRTASPLD